MNGSKIIASITIVISLIGASHCQHPSTNEDDSARCRLSGICEGSPTPTECAQHPPPLTSSPSFDIAARRDAQLACIFTPQERAQRVRDAAKWTWKGYSECAWGWDELCPLSCTGQHWHNLTLTPIDALDTLLLMDLHEEFEDAMQVVEQRLDFATAEESNLFETTIRILGGLLSAQHLVSRLAMNETTSHALLNRAVDLGARLATAFDSPTSIPYSDVNIATGSVSRSVEFSSTSEVGTLSLEFSLLSRLTGVRAFEDKAMAVHQALTSAVLKYSGLLPQYVNPADASMSVDYFMLGARTDSYYEYLLKQWIMTGQTDGVMLGRFVQAMQEVRRRLVRRTRDVGANGELGAEEEVEVVVGGEDGVTEDIMYNNGKEPHHEENEGETPPKILYNDTAGDDDDAGESSFEDEQQQQQQQPKSSLLYIAEASSKQTIPKMDHLVCFLPGVLALADLYNVSTKLSEDDMSDLELAQELAETCYQLYKRTPAGLAPEIVFFQTEEDDSYPGAHASDVGGGEFAVKEADAHNLLRPETVESLFLLWKVTGNPKYREQGWLIFRAFERWTRVEGVQQCLASDPGAAITTASYEASVAAASEAARSVVEGVCVEEAVHAGIHAAKEALLHMRMHFSERLKRSGDEELWWGHVAEEMCIGAARAAATAAATAVNHILQSMRNSATTAAAATTTDNGTPSSTPPRQELDIDAIMAAITAPIATTTTPTITTDNNENGNDGDIRGSGRLCGDYEQLVGGGYSNLQSVITVPPPRRDKMESFWIAETLKYLYLLFTEPPDRCLPEHTQSSCSGSGSGSVGTKAKLPLTEYVFNTEAHPLPIVGPVGERSRVHVVEAIDMHHLHPFSTGSSTSTGTSGGLDSDGSGDGAGSASTSASGEEEDEEEDEYEDDDDDDDNDTPVNVHAIDVPMTVVDAPDHHHHHNDVAREEVVHDHTHKKDDEEEDEYLDEDDEDAGTQPPLFPLHSELK